MRGPASYVTTGHIESEPDFPYGRGRKSNRFSWRR